MKLDPQKVREALKDGQEILIGIGKQIAPGARELVGTSFEVSSLLVGVRLEPYFSSIWLPVEQGLMTVEEVRVGGFRLDKLTGTRSFMPDGWVILRLADPVRIKEGDEVLLDVRNAAEPSDVERLARSIHRSAAGTELTDARDFRAMLGFVIQRDRPAPPLIVS